ncbi:MAG: YceI family protein [Bryobacteraceae bacterium]
MRTKTLLSRYAVAASLALALGGSGLAQSAYTIDSSHSSAQFSVRHMMISNVKGEFTNVTGSIVHDANNPAASKVEASIDASTINTREPKRDAHLKSADFFDTAKFPVLAFKSKKVWKDGQQLKVQGDLTIRGVTREVVWNVEGPAPETKDPWGNVRLGATATTKISRKDWGLTWNQTLEAGGVLVGDEVAITLDIEAVKSAPLTSRTSQSATH